MLELKPCPFCGREVKMFGGSEDRTPTALDCDPRCNPYFIICECGAESIMDFDWEKVAYWWNRRAEPQKANDAGATNADRIRAMSDEELAVKIVRRGYTPPCFMCVPKMRDFDHCDGRCTSGVTKWLQQPVKEEKR